MRGLGLEELTDSGPSRQRDLAAAVIGAAVIGGSSKLATARGLRAETAASSLGEVLGLGPCDEDDLYAAMDWLGPRQETIEDALAARHLSRGTPVLYDVSSAAFEGRTCPLGEIGHARDGVRGRLQIAYGVLTTAEGIPVAAEVFTGNTGDPSTLASQVAKLKERFSLAHVAVVGDRGMITKARIREDLKPAELDWVTALRGPAIRALVTEGAIQPTLFDETDMAEITSPDYPRERLIACYNPFLEAERARKRGELLAATEAELEKIAAATRRVRRPLRGKDDIALAVGKVINKKKVAKHFIVEVTEEGLSWRRDESKIAAEAALDGIYVISTSLTADVLGTGAAVESYKALENVERVFRGMNTDLLIRPIRHRLEDRVKTHVLIRTLAYYVTWHMQQRLAPMLFKDDNPAARQPTRPSPVAPAGRSPAARTTKAVATSSSPDSGTATTPASATAGWLRRIRSTSPGCTTSPWQMKLSATRPTIQMYPSSSGRAASPVRSHPSSVSAAAVSSGRFQYPVMTFGPRTSSSPAWRGPTSAPAGPTILVSTNSGGVPAEPTLVSALSG